MVTAKKWLLGPFNNVY